MRGRPNSYINGHNQPGARKKRKKEWVPRFEALPVEPLRDLMMDRWERDCATTPYDGDGPQAVVARIYSQCWGTSQDGAKRYADRVLRGRIKHIHVNTADQWSIALGYTLSMVYPEIYQ